MSTHGAVKKLEKRIDHYYDSYSARRVALATFLVGAVSIGLCWTAYYLTLNIFIATGVFAVVSLVAINVVMFMIVPPTEKLAESKALLLGALATPKRIKSASKNKVRLADADGKVRVLTRFEQGAWNSIVVPYFVTRRASGEPQSTVQQTERQPEVEKKVLVKRQAELVADNNDLLVERTKLAEERAALHAKTKELRKMQDQLENRVSRVEASEADLTRLKANLQRRLEERENAEVDREELVSLQAKAAELKTKELALEALKQELTSDRGQLEAQQQQFEGGAEGAQGSTASSDLIDSKVKELEGREAELEERLQYVANVENDLIDRLNLLSEREASVEQTEVEAGIRKD